MTIFNYLRMAVCHPFFILNLFYILSFNVAGQTIPNELLPALKNTQELKIKTSRSQLNSINTKHPFQLLIDDYNDILELLIDENPRNFDDIEALMEERLDDLNDLSNKESPWFKLVKAEIKFHWGIVNYKYGNEITAIWNINQAHSLIKENRKRFPDFIPNLKTLGIFHIIIGALPNNYQWIMEKIGFKGDINLGLKELEKCSKEDNIFQFESKIIYTYINAHLLNDYKNAISIFEKEYANTNNIALNYLLVSLYSNTHQSEKALKLIVNRPKNESYPQFEFYHYKLASCYFQKGEYEKAIDEYYIFLNRYKGKNYVKSTYHKLALCYYFLDQKEEQNKALNNIDNYGWKVSDEDKYAQKFFENGEFPDKSLAKARYFCDGGYFDKALLELNSKQFKSLHHRIEMYYRLGRINDLQNNYNKALENYNNAIKLNIVSTSNSYFAPNACLKAATIHINNKNIVEAKKMLNQAISYKNHEYENSIEMKAKSLLKTIKD